MTFTLRFLPEVEEDVLAAYEWYETKSPGLGEDFLRTFYACASEITRNPLLYPKVYGEFRRRLIKRFPYAVYFKVEGNEVYVCQKIERGLKDVEEGRLLGQDEVERRMAKWLGE